MDADSPDHEERLRKLEQCVPDLACQLTCLEADLRLAITNAVAESEARMRAYIDARIAPIEQTLRWVIGLLVTLLFGMVGLATAIGSILARLQ